MPDVGLTTAGEPLKPDYRVVIKYSVEVEGLPVYQESYDVDQLRKELQHDEKRVSELWLRRLKCAVSCRDKAHFSARLTTCIATGSLGVSGDESGDSGGAIPEDSATEPNVSPTAVTAIARSTAP